MHFRQMREYGEVEARERRTCLGVWFPRAGFVCVWGDGTRVLGEKRLEDNHESPIIRPAMECGFC